MKRYGFVLLTAVVLSGVVSCKKLFDTLPEQVLDKDQMYRNVYDADAAVVGLYGKLMGVAEQYVVLNELRADLMEVTSNADNPLIELNNHKVTKGNKYANPRPFYQLILDCNDVLKNFKLMRADKKFSEDQYNQRYSDVGALRSWLYMQLGVHYDSIPYVTDPLETIDAVKDRSKFPRIPFSQVLDSLINFTETLPFKLPYPAGSSLLTTVDNLYTGKFFINKKCLLGDLYLWRTAFKPGNTDDYVKAASNYKDVLETYSASSNLNELLDYFKVRYADVATNNDFSIGYVRFREQDINAFIDNNTQGWRSMFARGQDTQFNWEWIWTLYFDKNFKPGNPFINLFSNNGGSYLLKPSQEAIDNWNTQVQSNNFPFDGRGRLTYKMINGQPVIMKYLYNYVDPSTYLPINVLEKPGKWFLYRAAQLHLHYAEAANRANRHKIAYALVNNGLLVNFDNNPGAGLTRDVTNTQQTFDAYPFNFDARYGDYPSFRSPWYKNTGVRNRANLKPLTVTGDSTISIENMIVSESGLELAYEGTRWPDLLRVAIRRNDPSIVANRIYNKLSKDGVGNAAEVQAKLLRKEWFLPFEW
jgi:hypothetical protein